MAQCFNCGGKGTKKRKVVKRIPSAEGGNRKGQRWNKRKLVTETYPCPICKGTGQV
jgi:hypothetical protein